MGVFAWLILFAWAAILATATQSVFFRHARGPRDFDWIYTAGGALIGGFTAHVWYPGFRVVFDGLYLLQALAGGVLGGVLVELFYRFYIRRRQLA